MPPGYIRTADNWRCAPGYVGAPKAGTALPSASCLLRNRVGKFGVEGFLAKVCLKGVLASCFRKAEGAPLMGSSSRQINPGTF